MVFSFPNIQLASVSFCSQLISYSNWSHSCKGSTWCPAELRAPALKNDCVSWGPAWSGAINMHMCSYIMLIKIHAELMQIFILVHDLQLDNIGCPPVQLITKQWGRSIVFTKSLLKRQWHKTMVCTVKSSDSVDYRSECLELEWYRTIEKHCYSNNPLSFAMILAIPVCPSLRCFRALTRTVQLGSPLLMTWSSFCNHAVMTSSRKVLESIFATTLCWLSPRTSPRL